MNKVHYLLIVWCVSVIHHLPSSVKADNTGYGFTPVDVRPCSGRPGQSWRYENNNLIAEDDGRCLQIGDCNTTPGDQQLSVVQCGQSTCSSQNQVWTFNGNSIVSKLDGQCIDFNVEDGKVQTWACSGAPNQNWTLRPDGSLLNGADVNICLSVDLGSVYSNPVMDRNFPDPTVIRGSDGVYYAYSTMSPPDCHICISTSTDLVNWSPVQEALVTLPSWSATDIFWAPDVSEHDNVYYMFFAANSANGSDKCIGIALSYTGYGPFIDIGHPLICGDPSHIDPKMFDAPDGNIYLYWGSAGYPIRGRQLDSSRVRFADGSSPVDIIQTSNEEYEALVEGPWLTYNPRQSGYIYMYYSGNNCCGPTAHYAVMVARSLSPLGPFEKYGQPILALGGRWTAPGHNCIYTDTAGEDWIFYHSIDLPVGNYYVRKLLLDRISYINDWPYVANTNSVPTNSSQIGPVSS